MTKEFIKNIVEKKFDTANAMLEEKFVSIVEKKLWEKKKDIAAKMNVGRAKEAKMLAKKKRTGLIVEPKSGNVKRILKKNIKPSDIQAVEE